MKPIILLFTLLFSFEALASIGVITAVKGSATVERNQQIIQAKAGLTIEQQDTISTQANTLLQIIFSDKTTVSLGANTRFAVNSYLYDNANNSAAELSLTKGFLKSVSGKIGKLAPQRFKIRTKTATIGIRGTIYSIYASEKQTILKTFQGETYLVDNASGKSYSVPQNRQLSFNNVTKEAKISKIKVTDILVNKQGKQQDKGQGSNQKSQNKDSSDKDDNSNSETKSTGESADNTDTVGSLDSDNGAETPLQTDNTNNLGDTTEGVDDTATDSNTVDNSETANDNSGSSDDSEGASSEDSGSSDNGETADNGSSNDDSTSTGTSNSTTTNVLVGNEKFTSYGYTANSDSHAITDVWSKGVDQTSTETIDRYLAGKEVRAEYNGGLLAVDQDGTQAEGTITIIVDYRATGSEPKVTGQMEYRFNQGQDNEVHWKPTFEGDVSNQGFQLSNFSDAQDVQSTTGSLSGKFYGDNAAETAGTFELNGENQTTGVAVSSQGSFAADTDDLTNEQSPSEAIIGTERTKVQAGADNLTAYGYWLENNVITEAWAVGTNQTSTEVIDNYLNSDAEATYNGEVFAFDQDGNQAEGTIQINVDFANPDQAISGHMDYMFNKGSGGEVHWKPTFDGSVNNQGYTVSNFGDGEDIVDANGELSGKFYGSNGQETAGTFELKGFNKDDASQTNPLTSTGSFSGMSDQKEGIHY